MTTVGSLPDRNARSILPGSIFARARQNLRDFRLAHIVAVYMRHVSNGIDIKANLHQVRQRSGILEIKRRISRLERKSRVRDVAPVSIQVCAKRKARVSCVATSEQSPNLAECHGFCGDGLIRLR